MNFLCALLATLVACYTWSSLAHGALSELDGGVLYNLAWLSKEETVTEDAEQSNSEHKNQLTELLPNTLLEEGQWTEETVLMKTADNEQYKCVLPGSSLDSDDKAGKNEESAELMPEYLLRSLQHQCTRLLMGYWNYELCHGGYLRQFHEEKLQDGRVKVDEYMLGEFSEDLTDTPSPPTPPQDGGQIPVWPMHGREYPYYSVEMGGGTPCDIKGNEPRSVVIRYICDQEAYKYGSLLRVDEVTSCKYEALVTTLQLCQNSRYRLEEIPILPITCHPQADSPRLPQALVEQEIMSTNLKTGSAKATPTDQSESLYDSGRSDSSRSKVDTKTKRDDSKTIELDRGFIRSFLNGEMCLRGGSGWWLHEVCNSQIVKQLHMEQSGERVEVVLGQWEAKAHREWFRRAGKRKMSKNQVVHLYQGGDVCEVTKAPRQCLVKYKCVKSAKPSQISLYLEEPTTCSYALTVEAAFVCTLLQHLDEDGVFDLDSFEAARADGKEAGKEEVKVEGEAGNVREEAKNKAEDDDTEGTKDNKATDTRGNP